VTIIVSKGPVLVQVPDVTLKQGQGRREDPQGSRLGGRRSPSVFGGVLKTVRFQDPAAGTMVRRGTVITLTDRLTARHTSWPCPLRAPAPSRRSCSCRSRRCGDRRSSSSATSCRRCRRPTSSRCASPWPRCSWSSLLAPTARPLATRLGRSAGLGVAVRRAQILQTIGLAHTDASVSGFVTGTYVVLTPSSPRVLLRERVPASTWYAVLLATAGLALLSLNGFSSVSGRRSPSGPPRSMPCTSSGSVGCRHPTGPPGCRPSR
jgi:hypothetical protein